jgi:hypothetical protein
VEEAMTTSPNERRGPPLLEVTASRCPDLALVVIDS